MASLVVMEVRSKVFLITKWLFPVSFKSHSGRSDVGPAHRDGAR